MCCRWGWTVNEGTDFNELTRATSSLYILSFPPSFTFSQNHYRSSLSGKIASALNHWRIRVKSWQVSNRAAFCPTILSSCEAGSSPTWRSFAGKSFVSQCHQKPFLSLKWPPLFCCSETSTLEDTGPDLVVLGAANGKSIAVLCALGLHSLQLPARVVSWYGISLMLRKVPTVVDNYIAGEPYQ